MENFAYNDNYGFTRTKTFVIMKYRIVGKYKNNELIYKVQKNFLFGFPLFWTTVKYWGPEAPHPDLAIPGCCTINCVFNDSMDAEKCLNGLMNKS